MDEYTGWWFADFRESYGWRRLSVYGFGDGDIDGCGGGNGWGGGGLSGNGTGAEVDIFREG